ncbi:hypothetical protein RFI_12464 [Reticulomyxa filosa]|uniref:Kelch motif family protein n=1 Tax=Reticulomyxa filosa TaxID=46433 RepID=X6NFZ8_RETFI|nr:hypothetical protein RFI_12464 [Reticulomyxa filosa]|eukprot:ETO24694.1 hypothetical protein RFI_12464 [Reticulomyxa filosa]
MANQNQHLITSIPFQNVRDLPLPLEESQCVLHKHELLVCGGQSKRTCYSYHTVKNEYKLICEYPSDIELNGHCVVKLVNKGSNKNRDQITLLSFGGEYKHTLVMKYVSTWNSDNDNEMNNFNQWIPFTDNHDHPVHIGRDYDDYQGVRAVIGGRDNNLLFITYYKNNISVFDLNTFQFIKHNTLPASQYASISYHCFVSTAEKSSDMILFCFDTGLSIKYDEDSNNFQFHQLPVCKVIALLNYYAYVYIDDVILFFGGYCYKDGKYVSSESVHKYSIQENKWMTFQITLPSPLRNCVAILSKDNTYIHIIGGQNDKNITVSTHMKTKVHIWDISLSVLIKFFIQYWIRTLNVKLGWIDYFDKIIFKYSKF